MIQYNIAGTQPGSFWGQDISQNRDPLINVLYTRYKRRAPQGKYLVFLFQDTL